MLGKMGKTCQGPQGRASQRLHFMSTQLCIKPTGFLVICECIGYGQCAGGSLSLCVCLWGGGGVSLDDGIFGASTLFFEYIGLFAT